MNPIICILLTTYRRTDVALKTIQGIKQYLQWDQVYWYISDDGTPEPNHVKQLIDKIGSNYRIEVYNSNRRGVGHGMNHCLWRIFDETPLCIIAEDDWQLTQPLDIRPYVELLMNHEDIGYCRMGYLSAGPKTEIISAENKLWLRFQPSNYQYNYAGHAGLRHHRLHQKVGYFSEGLSPGQNELDFCSRYNATPDAPAIVWNLDYGHQGAFHHIGGDSLSTIMPE